MSSSDSEDEERRQLALMIRLYRRERRRPIGFTRFMPEVMMEFLVDDVTFAETFGIDRYEFETLHKMIESKIRRKRSRFRENIGTREQLAICLRFMATGESMRSLSKHYSIPPTTLPILIREVCKSISGHLMPIVMKTPTKKMWEKNAEDFKKKFDMPNCIGAIEGKNLYVNKQKIVLLALVDADDQFIMVDVGYYRMNSFRGNVMDKSKMGKRFMKNELNVPQNQPLAENSEPLPFVILGSSFFPAKPYLMTKYSKAECAVNETHQVFNTRLSRAKVTVNRALIHLRNKWRIFQGPLLVSPDDVEKIVLSCCCLQNFFSFRVRQPFPLDYPSDPVHVSITEDQIIKLQSLVPAEPVDIRDKFKKYFLSPEGQVRWQWQDIE